MGTKKAPKEKPLGHWEKHWLRKIERGGCVLFDMTERQPKALAKLVARGLVRELPGLLEGPPQGYTLA